MNLDEKYFNLVKYISAEAPFKADIAIILGSGLGDLAHSIKLIKSIDSDTIPSYPKSSVPGHEGIIHFGELYGKKILIFQGRIHFYEGYEIYDCVLPVYLANKLGCRTIILTNVAGGINPDFSPGSLILISSIITYQIKKELMKLLQSHETEITNRSAGFPSSKLNSIIRKSAYEETIEVKEGVYYYVKGPNYETPAEIEMIRRSGGDLVGMSTAYEAVYASYLGMEASVISNITNYASGISAKKLSHKDVTEAAGKTIDILERLIKQSIKNINY